MGRTLHIGLQLHSQGSRELVYRGVHQGLAGFRQGVADVLCELFAHVALHEVLEFVYVYDALEHGLGGLLDGSSQDVQNFGLYLLGGVVLFPVGLDGRFGQYSEILQIAVDYGDELLCRQLSLGAEDAVLAHQCVPDPCRHGRLGGLWTSSRHHSLQEFRQQGLNHRHYVGGDGFDELRRRLCLQVLKHLHLHLAPDLVGGLFVYVPAHHFVEGGLQLVRDGSEHDDEFVGVLLELLPGIASEHVLEARPRESRVKSGLDRFGHDMGYGVTAYKIPESDAVGDLPDQILNGLLEKIHQPVLFAAALLIASRCGIVDKDAAQRYGARLHGGLADICAVAVVYDVYGHSNADPDLSTRCGAVCLDLI